jgi:hypothetical protein
MSPREPISSSPPAKRRSLAAFLLPKLALAVIIGGILAGLATRMDIKLVPAAEDFDRITWWTIPGYLALLTVTHFFRASRWRFLIAPVKKLPLREVILLNWIGFFAIFALPLRLGEVVRPTLTKMRQKVPVSAGFGTVAVERVVDGLLTSLCVAWALFVLPRLPSDHPMAKALPFYGYLALTVFGSAFLGLALFLWQRNIAIWLVQHTFGLVSKKLGRVLAEKVDSVADGVRSIADARLATGFLAESLLYWGSNAAGMWLLAWGCGVPLHYGHAVAIMGILAIGILLPAGPGLFGSFQLAIAAALQLYFASEVVATSGALFIFLLYILQAAFFVVTGVVPLLAAHIPFADILRRRAPPAGGTVETA